MCIHQMFFISDLIGSSSGAKRDNISSNDRSGSSTITKKSKSGSVVNVSERGPSHSGRSVDRGGGSSVPAGVTGLGRDTSGIGDRSGGIAGVITEHGGGKHHHDKVIK